MIVAAAQRGATISVPPGHFGTRSRGGLQIDSLTAFSKAAFVRQLLDSQGCDSAPGRCTY
jgi:hypothetical protein